MEVHEWPIDKVKPYVRNPRDNDDAVDATAESIKQFGWQQAIVVDKAGVVIAGHTRLKAAKQLGLDKVPVKVADTLSEEQVKAYRLADNKTGELADWDKKMLEAELNAIADIDMEQFGFEVADEVVDEATEESEIKFGEELNEENNYIVLKFDNSVDWQQAKTVFNLKSVKDSNTKMFRKGVGRVLDGTKLINDLIAKGVNLDEYFTD